ncbi:MAG: hypothetical protein N3F10_05160 [Candidatus Bathyarchaeota archaeon]|nr:hypothetical protein [Candidatus Bathyarchaeota archaeon]
MKGLIHISDKIIFFHFIPDLTGSSRHRKKQKVYSISESFKLRNPLGYLRRGSNGKLVKIYNPVNSWKGAFGLIFLRIASLGFSVHGPDCNLQVGNKRSGN